MVLCVEIQTDHQPCNCVTDLLCLILTRYIESSSRLVLLDWCQGPTEGLSRACLAKNVAKTDIYWGLYRIHNFVFLTLLQILVPHLEILFYINH